MFKIFTKPKPEPTPKQLAEIRKQKLSEGYSNLRDILAQILSTAPDIHAPLREKWRSLLATYDMVDGWSKSSEKKCIGVYGTPKMGKSTLLNSIAGVNILPEAPIPKTGSIIDLERNDSEKNYTLTCIDAGGFLDIYTLESPEAVRDFLNNHASQNSPYERVCISGPFPHACEIFEDNSILRDTPGAEADAENAVKDELIADSQKTIKAINDTHIPLFCISSQPSIEDSANKAFYDRFFSHKECIHVITRCDNPDEHDQLRKLFKRHFGLQDTIAHNSITCTGMSDKESKKVDINLNALIEEIRRYSDTERLRKQILDIGQNILRHREKLGWQVYETQKTRLEDALEQLKQL